MDLHTRGFKIKLVDMGSNVGALFLLFLSSLTLCGVIKLFHKFWWLPSRIKRVMSSQGIYGPPYRLVHGNTKEIANIKDQAKTTFTDISHDIYPRIQPHFVIWFRLYGKNFLDWYGPQPELVITDPDIIKEIANNKSVSFERPDLGSYHKKMLGDGLVTSKGAKWARQRKLANHAFSADSLKNMIPAMVESVEILLHRWEKMTGHEVEVHAEFRILTAEVISKTAFGTSYIQGKDVFEMLKEMSTIAGRNYYNPRLPGLGKILKSSDDLRSDELRKNIEDQLLKTIMEREKLMAVDHADNWGTDFLGHLVKANHHTDEHYRLSTQDIIDECKTFYVSGDGTTSLVLSWAVLLLSVHTEWQERAREEVFEIFGKENPRPEGIAKLKTVGMIINETLRLYPPGTAIIRKNEKQVKLASLTIPSNFILHVPVLALHHDRKIWGEDAQLFRPDRFCQGISKATKNNPSAYMPFGFGPRNCVGSNFATNTAKVALAMILQHFRFTPSPNYIHSPVHLLMLIPKTGVQVMLHAL